MKHLQTKISIRQNNELDKEDDPEKKRANDREETPIILPRQKRMDDIDAVVDQKKPFAFPALLTD